MCNPAFLTIVHVINLQGGEDEKTCCLFLRFNCYFSFLHQQRQYSRASTALPERPKRAILPMGPKRNRPAKQTAVAGKLVTTINYSIWCDDGTGLCWQDPQKDAYDLEDPGLIQPDAVRYCEELVFGGYDDWRLPNIDEMRTVISGNPPAETGGACPMTEGSPRDDMGDEACGPIASCEGPGMGDCYWIPEFTGTCCDKPDPASVGHPLEFVSSTVASDNPRLGRMRPL